MKKVLTIKHEEQIEIDVQFPLYIQPSNYSALALIDEETYLKVSMIEKWTSVGEPQQYSVWISTAFDKYEINTAIELLHSGKGKRITPEEFDAFYFNARKLVSIQFNKLDQDALPE